jgi:arsenate reductase
MSKKRVLFLCTGNSCRSQMAEGLVNRLMSAHWEAHSAGVCPAGYVHPLAVQVMAELGIDISGHRSKAVDEFRDVSLDLVLTVCDDAAESCPLWLGSGKTEHIGFPDPAQAAGSDLDRLLVFRTVRDAIRHKVLALLKEEIESNDARHANGTGSPNR